jgi:hypothetical protein
LRLEYCSTIFLRISPRQGTPQLSDTQNIQQIILDLYQALSSSDEAAYKALVHPQIRTVNIGNSGEVHVFALNQIIEYTINGLKNAVKQIPGFFSYWENIKFHNITIQDVTASVEVSYQMVMPESTGSHHSFIQLVKENEKWLVINIIDRGIEKEKNDRDSK